MRDTERNVCNTEMYRSHFLVSPEQILKHCDETRFCNLTLLTWTKTAFELAYGKTNLSAPMQQRNLSV